MLTLKILAITAFVLLILVAVVARIESDRRMWTSLMWASLERRRRERAIARLRDSLQGAEGTRR